jgi:hypothetical protein
MTGWLAPLTRRLVSGRGGCRRRDGTEWGGTVDFSLGLDMVPATETDTPTGFSDRQGLKA